MATLEERLAAAKAKTEAAAKKEREIRNKLNQRQAQEKRMQAKQDRARDSRRKILVGAMILGQMEKDPQQKQRIMSQLNQYLEKPIDRELFGLTLHSTDGTV